MIKIQIQNFFNKCKWSWEGWCSAWQSEASLKQWSVLCVLSCALALWLDLSASATALLMALSIFVVAAELINTAVERTVDLVTTEHHPLAKQAKDISSAFVALNAITAFVAWCVILLSC